MIKERAKRVLYFYQRAFWYINIAKGELLKPLGFWNETILILTFLTVSSVKTNAVTVFSVYISALIVLLLLGKIITKVGIVKYNARIANRQNPEMMKILSELREIKEIINNKKYE